MNIISPIFNLLLNDPFLLAMVGEFDTEPCIFIDDPLPELAPRPYIWISSPLRNRDWTTKLTRGREFQLEIWTAVDNHGSTSVLQANGIAEQVRTTVSQFDELIVESNISVRLAEINGPLALETDESVIGRKIIATFKAM